MELCVLGSGSSGNCSALRIGGRIILLDAGFGPRNVAKRLADSGLGLADIDAILLTHLDTDHFKPTWFNVIQRFGIQLYCHRSHVYHLYQHPATSGAPGGGIDARQLHRAGLLHVFDAPFIFRGRGGSDGGAGETASVTPVHLAHDRTGTVGYRIDSATARLGYATDLGRVPDHLLEAFTDVHLLALESNYDPPMQLASPRPQMLKRRIMGGSGHLSNEQAFDAVRHIFTRSRQAPRHVVLLHLSRQCNCPTLVRKLFSQHPHLASRLCLSSQTAPTPWLHAHAAHTPLPGEQLTMFG